MLAVRQALRGGCQLQTGRGQQATQHRCDRRLRIAFEYPLAGSAERQASDERRQQHALGGGGDDKGGGTSTKSSRAATKVSRKSGKSAKRAR